MRLTTVSSSFLIRRGPSEDAAASADEVAMFDKNVCTVIELILVFGGV